MAQWFSGLGDVPGVAYASRAGRDVRRLPGYGSRPKVVRYQAADGTVHESFSWELPGGGGTGRSPAGAHGAFPPDVRDETARQALGRLWEALELPGELADYHFAIQRTIEVLSKARRGEPWVYDELETLCLLSIALVEAHPATVRFEGQDRTSYAAILAFGYLIDLYIQEGEIEEALAIARRAGAFDQCQMEREALELRIKASNADA